jgi:protein-tyrosine-phosphatase
VLVLDGETSASLAMVRSFGRRGVPVIVGSVRPDALANRSRYAADMFLHPDPGTCPAEFRKAVQGLLGERRVTLTVPVAPDTCAALMTDRHLIDDRTRLVLASNESLTVALSRRRTREAAARLGVPLSPCTEVHSIAEGLEAAHRLGFPVTVAPDGLSRRTGNGAPGSWSPYAATADGLARQLSRVLRTGAAHVSPRLGGEGVGLALLARGGVIVWVLQYRGHHDVTPIDGSSARQTSEPVDRVLLGHATLLMRALQWDGPARLLFRRDGTVSWLTRVDVSLGEAVPVAVAAGVDAAGLLHGFGVHDRGDFPGSYRVGARSRHLPSELAWARQDLPSAASTTAESRRPGVSTLVRLVRALGPWKGWETPSLSDPRPGLHEARALGADVWQSVRWRLDRARHRRRMRSAVRGGELAHRVRDARTVVFVCLGNIIRSAFAAELARARGLECAGLRIGSVGLDASPGDGADASAVRCARRFGVDLGLHRARRLEASDVEGMDLVLAMEIDQVVEICRRFPRHRQKVYLFGCLEDADHPRDVADPLDGPREVFERCFDQIERGLRRLIEMRPPVSRAVAVAGEITHG